MDLGNTDMEGIIGKLKGELKERNVHPASRGSRGSPIKQAAFASRLTYLPHYYRMAIHHTPGNDARRLPDRLAVSRRRHQMTPHERMIY